MKSTNGNYTSPCTGVLQRNYKLFNLHHINTCNLIFHSLAPCRQFTLVHVVNVVKRVDGVQGSRYLLELELRDAHGQLLRLSHYIYALNLHSRHRGKDIGFRPMKPKLVLCNPVGFRWYPAATVYFIVPGTPAFGPC